MQNRDLEKYVVTFTAAKLTIATAFTVALLAGCASAPKQIELPASSLKSSTKSVEGSAIAFQASDGQCNQSNFKISPRLEDGKYGPAELLKISSSTFKMKSKSLTQSTFASSRKQLYVKTMAPGTYAVTRLMQSLRWGEKL